MSLLSRAKARKQTASNDDGGLVKRARARAIQEKGGSSTNWQAVGNGSASHIYDPNERSMRIIANAETVHKNARSKKPSKFEQRLDQATEAKADKILGKDTRPLRVVETPTQTAVREAMPDVVPVPKSTLGESQKTQIGKIGDRLMQHPDEVDAKIAAANLDDESKQYLSQYIQGAQMLAEPSSRDVLIQGILGIPGLNLVPAVGKAGEAVIGTIEKGVSNPVARLAAKTGVRAVQGGIEGAVASEAASIPDAIEHPREWIKAQPQIVGGGALMGAAGHAILRPILESIENAPKKISDAKTRAILSDAVIKAEQGDNVASAERFNEGLNRIHEYKNLPEDQKTNVFGKIINRLGEMSKSREAVTKIPESAEPEANTAPEQVETGTPHVSPTLGIVEPTKVVGKDVIAKTERGTYVNIPADQFDGVPVHQQEVTPAPEPAAQEVPQSPTDRRINILSNWFNKLDEANADPAKFQEVSHEVRRVWDATNAKLQKYYDAEPALLEESTHYPEMTPEQQQAFKAKYDAFYENRNNMENMVEQMQAHPVVQKLQALDAEQAQQDAIKQAAEDVKEQNRQAYQFGAPSKSDVPVFSKNDSTGVIGKTRLKGYDWNEVADSLGMTKEQIGDIIQKNAPKIPAFDNRRYGNEVTGWRRPGEPTSDFMTVEEAKVLSRALGLKINTKGAEPTAPVATIKQTSAVTPESEVTNDTQNTERLQGGHSLGQEPEQAELEQVPSGETTPAGGMLQAPGQVKPIPGVEKHVDLANRLTTRLHEDKPIDWRELTSMADDTFGGTEAAGTYNARDKADALEAAVNAHIRENAPDIMSWPHEKAVTWLEHLQSKLPTQTANDRTETQVELQQFSTPPAEAFAAAKALGDINGKTALEPSAGTGNLANFLRIGGAKVTTNEYPGEGGNVRAGLLAAQNYPVTRQDAEILNALSPEKYDVVLMNPPFSATGGRVKAHKTAFGAKHVEAALDMLKPGGRLVAIVGRGMGDNTPTFHKWFDDMSKRYAYRANLLVDGSAYSKYGTTFDNRILVFDNTEPSGYKETDPQLFSDEPLSVQDVADRLKELGKNGPEVTETSSSESGSTPKEVAGSQPTAPKQSCIRNTEQKSLDGILLPGKSDLGESGVQGVAGSNGSGTVVSGRSGKQHISDVVERERPGKGNNGNHESTSGRGVSTEGSSGNVGGRSNGDVERSGDRTGTQPDVNVEEHVTRQTGGDNSVVENNDTFQTYKAEIGNGNPHPSKLVETGSMGGVKTPLVNLDDEKVNSYIHFPREIIKKGASRLSDTQLELVVLADFCHNQLLPDGSRRGFFIGDGTGVGKGRESAGIITNNWYAGHRRILWLSANHNELYDAGVRDLTAVAGKDTIPAKKISDFKAGTQIDFPEGVVVCSYSTFANKRTSPTRFTQILEWLEQGKGDPVIIFDEAHKAANAVTNNALQKSSHIGESVIDIQNKLPNARVTYMTATSADDITDLGYAVRLGLWGSDTAFKTFDQFSGTIDAGGIGAMELVAREMKQMGTYVSRVLAFEHPDGKPLSYGELVVKPTPEMIRQYNEAADTWSKALGFVQNLVKEKKLDSRETRTFMSQYWGVHQKFFKSMLTGFQVPTLIETIENAMREGKAPVISIDSTHEGETIEKVSEGLKAGQELEDIDFASSDSLFNLVKSGFPVQLTQPMTDPLTGKTENVPVWKKPDGSTAVDKYGKKEWEPVIDPEKIRLRKQLLGGLDSLSVPGNPLDMIIDYFGADNVAEISGRSQRLIRNRKTGALNLEHHSQTNRNQELKDFQEGKRKIAIYTRAGEQGIDLHAGRKMKNQKQRLHIVFDIGWQTKGTLQGFGRTHRSDEVIGPEILLMGVDIAGYKRFLSSLASKLSMLGALQRGDRSSAGAGELAKYDFNSREGMMAARAALASLPNDTLKKMGISDNPEKWPTSPTGLLKQFFNRMMVLPVNEQNDLYRAFEMSFVDQINAAKLAGTYDQTVQDIKAEKIKKVSEQVIRTDPTSGAQTKYYHLNATVKNKRVSFAECQREWRDLLANGQASWRVNTKGRVGMCYWLDVPVPGTTETQRKYLVRGPNGRSRVLSVKAYVENWSPVKQDKAEELWQKQLDEMPATRQEPYHIIAGLTLPIYDRLGNAKTIVRVPLDGGERIVGTMLTGDNVMQTLRELGVVTQADAGDPGSVYNGALSMNANDTIHLAGKLSLVQGIFRGSPGIEIKYNGGLVTDSATQSRLTDMGIVSVGVYDKRLFVPSADAMANLLDKYPVVELPKSISTDIASRVNSRVSEVDLPTPSLSVKYINGSTAQSPESKTEGSFEFDNPDLESNWKENSKPITSKGFLSKIVECFHGLPALATRTYKDIPRTGFYAEANEALRVLGHQKSVQNSEAVRLIHGILIDLEYDPAAFDLFNRRIVLADFAETAAEGMQLPGGWDADTADAELKRVDEAINGNSKIEDALSVRRSVLEQVTQGYIAANKAVGYDPSKNLKRQDYFRHMVLDKMNLKYAGTMGTGKRVGVKKGRGFLKARKGSNLDISYNYVQSEWEVLSQMLYDTQIAKALKRIQDNYDIKEDLKLEAAHRNVSAILPHFEDVAKELTESEDNTSGHKYTAEEAMRRMLNWKQSAAIDGLQKMALNDDLPAGRAGEYEDLLNELVDNYLHNRSIKSVMGEDWTPADRIELPEWAHNRLMQYMNYLLQEHGGEPGSGKAAMFFHGIREKKQYIKAALGDEYLDWRDLVSEVPAPGGQGYAIFQPDRGNVFYQTESSSEQLAGKIFEGVMELGDVPLDKLRNVLVLGGKRREWVLPEGITATLENLPRTRTDDPVLDFVAGKPLNLWKQYQLLNPERAIKYNLRNLSGDIEPVIMMNPGILKYVPQSARELYQMYRTSRLPQGTLKDWMDRGGEQGLLQAQEMGELNDLAIFSKLLNKNAGVLGIPKELFLKYWRTARLATDFRESLLRYAAYLEYLDEVNNGTLKNHGGSKRTEVEGLHDPRDKAYKLSNELLGAYDEISQLGRSIRKYVAPFWSWQEVNFGRTVRMFRNTLEDAPGAKARAGFTKAVFTALRLAKFGILASALWSILSAWNYLHFSKEEDELPDDIKSKPHLIFGRDAKTGDILYLSRLGAVNDFTEWFGADTAPSDIQAYLNGDKSIMEIFSDDAKKPVNKMAQAINPWVKTYTELSTKEKLYPDIFNPQSYKDRGEYLADSVSLGDEYRKLTGKPSRPTRENAERYFADVSDPEQSAYYDILGEKTGFLKKHGKGGDRGGNDNPKSTALWNYKRALRWGDIKSARKFYKQYFKLGGTDRGIEQSFKMNDPLYGLGSGKPQEYDPTAEVQAETKPDLRKAFIHSLNKAQRKKLKMAIRYYNNLQHTRSKIETRG
ncbi:MAG: strawberry notch-like NTP hydrolase domain-containing protein [Armatimonadota bacterium]